MPQKPSPIVPLGAPATPHILDIVPLFARVLTEAFSPESIGDNSPNARQRRDDFLTACQAFRTSVLACDGGTDCTVHFTIAELARLTGRQVNVTRKMLQRHGIEPVIDVGQGEPARYPAGQALTVLLLPRDLLRSA